MKTIKKYFGRIVIVAVVLFALIQLIPFGHDHTNPPVQTEPNWSSPEARALVQQECFACHSNETEWPWYSNIAPASWLITMDVNNGRRHLNFSETNVHPAELDEITWVIQNGEMPPIQYTLPHPNARMDDQQKQALIQALESSLK